MEFHVKEKKRKEQNQSIFWNALIAFACKAQLAEMLWFSKVLLSEKQ